MGFQNSRTFRTVQTLSGVLVSHEFFSPQSTSFALTFKIFFSFFSSKFSVWTWQLSHLLNFYKLQTWVLIAEDLVFFLWVAGGCPPGPFIGWITVTAFAVLRVFLAAAWPIAQPWEKTIANYLLLPLALTVRVGTNYRCHTWPILSCSWHFLIFNLRVLNETATKKIKHLWCLKVLFCLHALSSPRGVKVKWICTGAI